MQMLRDRLGRSGWMPASRCITHVHAKVRFGWVGRMHQVHDDAVTGRKPGLLVVGAVRGELRVFPKVLDIARRQVRVTRDVHPHRDHGDRSTGRIRVAPDVVGRVRAVGVSTHRGDPAVFGLLSAVVLALLPSHAGGIRRGRWALHRILMWLPWIVPSGRISGTLGPVRPLDPRIVRWWRITLRWNWSRALLRRLSVRGRRLMLRSRRWRPRSTRRRLLGLMLLSWNMRALAVLRPMLWRKLTRRDPAGRVGSRVSLTMRLRWNLIRVLRPIPVTRRIGQGRAIVRQRRRTVHPIAEMPRIRHARIRCPVPVVRVTGVGTTRTRGPTPITQA